MTPQSQRDSLRELSARATPGPWQDGFDDREGIVSVGLPSVVGDGNVVCEPPDFRMEASYAHWPANAALIVALRNGADELLDEVERLRELVENAYIEGIQEGAADDLDKNTPPDIYWQQSKARAALHPKQERDDEPL